MKIGVFCNKTTKKYLPLRDELYRVLKEQGVDFSVYENVEDVNDIDTLIVLGGDGTILKVATEIGKKGIRILGINSGNLGFLTEFEGDEIPNAITLLKNDFETQKRGVLEITINDKHYYALNEVFFQRRYREEVDNNVVGVTAKIDGKTVDNFIGDGVIVSTPTGSTAYSLSAGGPILTPDIHAFILTPVCTHSLRNRPIVYSDNSTMRIELLDENGELSMFCDGKFADIITNCDKVVIKKADFEVEFIKSAKSFFDKLLYKLSKWSN